MTTDTTDDSDESTSADMLDTIDGDDEPQSDYDRCGAERRDGGACRRFPTVDDETGEPINGRCPLHGGKSSGPPAGSANHYRHGATADPLNLIENDLLGPAELEWIYALRDAYLEEAPFGPDSAKVERLTRTCAMIFQEWKGQEVILEEGMAVEDVVGVTDDGEPVVSTREHYLCQRIDRLNDKVRHNLRELGLLDDPESQQADAEGDKAAALRELMAEADRRGDSS